MFLDTAVGKISLYIASAIFFIGLLYRLMAWFFKSVGTGEKDIPVSRKFFTGLEGILQSLFSIKFFSVLKVIIADVLLQIRILTDRKDSLAWIMHIMIFIGFVSLMIFHVFNIPENYSTLNPYMFLRNLMGLIGIIGFVMAIVRRSVIKKGTIKTGGADIFTLIILLVIFISGFMLEGLKITSHSDYKRMVEEYGDAEDVKGSIALEAYWVKNYSLVSPNIKEPVSSELLAQGKELNEQSCISCHSMPQSAFLSYAVAQGIKPAALGLDDAGIGKLMLFIHVISCLLGLAYIPFSKMFHVFSTPVSLVVAEVSDDKQENEKITIRQMIELDGCSHGGACHEDCPVRKRRQERVDNMKPFDTSLEYLSEKTYEELGSRKVSG